MGFELNPYEPGMVNCVIEGKQCTIEWYVDSKTISLVDPKVVTTIIKKIESVVDKMTVTRGTEHSFSGLKVKLARDNRAIITMKTYLLEATEKCGLCITSDASTPATK
jgi:hypothetical protein